MIVSFVNCGGYSPPSSSDSTTTTLLPNTTTTTTTIITTTTIRFKEPDFEGGEVRVIVPTEKEKGMFYVGGDFTSYNGTSTQRLVRLNADGTVDTSFNVGSGFDAVVNAIALAPDGDIYVGGDFTLYNGTPINRLVRLNADGTQDMTFNIDSGFDLVVHALAVTGEGLYVGGEFIEYNGESTTSLVRLNAQGARDLTFKIDDTVLDDTVYVITPEPHGGIYVGGEFEKNMIRLNANGEEDLSFNVGDDGFDLAVHAIVVTPDGYLYVGGEFETYQEDIEIPYIIRLDEKGTADDNFSTIITDTDHSIFDGFVEVISLTPEGDIYVGGKVKHNNISREGLIRLNSNGTVDSAFDTGDGFDGAVHAMTLSGDGNLTVGGAFTTYKGDAAKRLVRLDSLGNKRMTSP